LIIKGKKGAESPGDEPRAGHEPARETSAIIKRLGAAPAPTPHHIPRSAVMKRGTYTHQERRAAEEPQQAPDRGTVFHVPTGDRPHGAPPVGAGPATEAAPTIIAPTGPRVDEQMIEEAQRRGEAIVRQAQMDAKKLLEEAKIYAQQQFQEAERAGFEQGRQQGYTDMQRQVIDLVNQSRIMLAQTLAARERFLLSAQPEIAQLAMKIAERVTATMAADMEDVVRNQVSETLQKVKDRQEIIVHVNPDDLLVAREHRQMFERLLESPKVFEVVSDQKVDRGGCIIETNLGNVDARISTQLTALKLAFDEIIALEREEIERKAVEAERAAMPPPEPEPPPPAEPEPLPPPEPSMEGGAPDAQGS